MMFYSDHQGSTSSQLTAGAPVPGGVLWLTYHTHFFVALATFPHDLKITFSAIPF